jgi:ABC-type antimicrobial peptide transport system permease subunit
MNKYNEIFGTEYTTDNLDKFIPHKVTMTHYDYNDVDKQNPLFSIEVTIAGLLEKNASRTMDVSQDIYELFAKDYIRTYSLYFDGTDGIGVALDAAEELNFEGQSYAVEGIHTMTKVVDVFVPIFEIIALFLCAAVVFILVNFSSKMIKDKMHEIGILKALGTKNSTIVAVFGLQVVLIAILTCVLSTVGYYFLVDVANDVLFESMKQFVKSRVVLDLDFFTFMPKIALEDCALVAALSAVSMLIPMIKIKAIKPVKIIKAKE